MTDSVEAITTGMLSRALEAATLQHQATAANIANQATEGYVPVRVSFAAQMAALTGEAPAAKFEPVLDAQGRPATVRLDSEMADMARNAVQYQALARGLNKHLALLAMAAADGKK
jgi:flagellar basal-body rod protein FlgB